MRDVDELVFFLNVTKSGRPTGIISWHKFITFVLYALVQ